MGSPVLIPVLYDFASTICFVAHRVLQRMEGDLLEIGIELDWQPLDLAALAGWEPGVIVEGPRRENSLRVAHDLGVCVRMPAAWIDSSRAHAIALSLGKGPREAAWRERVWTAVFEEGRDVGDPKELERLTSDLGFHVDGPEIEPGIAHLASTTRAASDSGVTGLPAFVLNGFPISGIQEPATMRHLFQRHVDRSGRNTA